MKKFRFSMILMLAVLALTFGGGISRDAKAATRPRFTSRPAQTRIAKDGFSVNWWATDAAAFDVEIMDYSLPASQRKWESKGRVYEAGISFSGLKSGTNYSVRVTAISDTDSKVTTTSTANNFRTLIDDMKAVETESYDYAAKTAKVVWTPLGAADGYEYKLKKYSGKTIAEGRLTDSTTGSLTFTQLEDNTVYVFKIRALMTYEGKSYETPWKSINVFEQAPVTSVVQKGNKLTIKWSKMKGATGYQVYVSSKPRKGYVKVKSVGRGKSSVTVTKVKKTKISKKKKWYVYVVAKRGKDKSGRTYYWTSADQGKTPRYLY